MGLTSVETLKNIQDLVDLMFQNNSILDNIVYQMDIDPLNVHNLYEFCHFKLSHSFPNEFADKITDFALLRGDRIYRGALEKSDKTYTSIIECLNDIFIAYDNTKKQIELCINSAVKNTETDKAYEDFLRDFNVNVMTLYWKQAKTLLDGAKQFDQEGLLPLFNSNFKNYIILPNND